MQNSFDYGFSTFLEYVPYLAEAKLPTMAAQYKDGSEKNRKLEKHLTNIKPRMAAVMMLFIKEWDDTFGFNCAIPMRVHSGQIAFRRENGKRKMRIFCDSFRETHEEVGIHPDKMGNY
jgi:hypothetical protein